MPLFLNTKVSRVVRYLNKYGFNNIKLIIYLINIKSSLDQVVSLEKYFIDILNPSLNINLVANSSGYYEAIAQKIRKKLYKQKDTPIYIYKTESFTLLHIFDSNQYIYNTINILYKFYYSISLFYHILLRNFY